MGSVELAHRLGALRERLVGLGGTHVKVVAVTKGFGPDVVAAALSVGLTDIGENFAQELLAKAASLEAAPSEVSHLTSDPPSYPIIGGSSDGAVLGQPRWHFVGQLQRNKVRKLAGVVHLWQSVDRFELASEIARRAPGAKVLVQVDITAIGMGVGIDSNKPQRGGCAPDATASLVEHCRSSGLEVKGLMGVGTPGLPEGSRMGFRKLASLGTELGLAELSMGMSDDLEVAVSEGATMVRVGTSLFGPRPQTANPVA